MSKVTVTSKTVEEAVESALNQLQTSREKVNIRVIEESSKGFLGFGSKPAVVEVEVLVPPEKETMSLKSVSDIDDAVVEPIETAYRFLDKVLAEMGLEVEIKEKENKDHVLFEVEGSRLGMMIGRRGQTLDALQYLTNLVANRHAEQYIRIIVDAENYRQRRKETLEQLADRVAKKAIRTGRKVILEPMNPAERKIIHTSLQNYAAVDTKSEGEDPNRRVVLIPK